MDHYPSESKKSIRKKTFSGVNFFKRSTTPGVYKESAGVEDVVLNMELPRLRNERLEDLWITLYEAYCQWKGTEFWKLETSSQAALEAMVAKQSRFSFFVDFAHPLSAEAPWIAAQGDILMGFWNPQGVDLEGNICIQDGVATFSRTFPAKTVTDVFPSQMVPMIKIVFQAMGLRLGGSGTLYPVFAYLRSEERRLLVLENLVLRLPMSPVKLAFAGGLWSMGEDLPSIGEAVSVRGSVEVLWMEALQEKRRREGAHRLVAHIEEELMAVTWHPRRFMDWCLDHTELADLCEVTKCG